MKTLMLANLILRDAAALLIVKATVVLALASVAAAAAQGFSAARRHMLWLVALLSCVWLVLSSPVVPAVMIHTPVLAQEVVTVAARPTAAAFPSSRSATAANISRAAARFPTAKTVRRFPARSIPVPSHPLIALWIIGCVALLVRHAVGFVGAARLARRATIANDDETARELARVTAAVGVRRNVRLGYSLDVQTPITFDVLKPYLLLPTEARSWPIERRRAVLVHEAAHIARGDWLSQAIGQLACELFWFHPLAWRAFARLRDDAERAADDYVLRSGMSPFEYAAHLLDLGHRTAVARPDFVAVGIVSTNDLERRFLAMFDQKRSRAAVTSRARALTTSAALAIVCPLASLRVAAPEQRMNAPRLPAPLRYAPLMHLSTPQPARAIRAPLGEGDTAGVSMTPEVRAAIDAQTTSETSRVPVALVDHPPPPRVAHPNFSGKWRSDTVAVPTRTEDFFVTDSSIITQSADSIAFDSDSHVVGDTRNYSRLHNITFDGAETSGVSFGERRQHATNVVASAVWSGDTLVLTSRVHGEKGREFETIERMTLSADGNTLSETSLNLIDGQLRYGRPLTFVLRRIAP
jgi:beta-lactamase regulating signal transducer with metallopeptidase domain